MRRRYRKKNPRLRVTNIPKYPRGFLAWTVQCWRMTDEEFLKQVGLDGYMVIRFIRMCRRLCWCAALLGMCVLVSALSFCWNFLVLYQLVFRSSYLAQARSSLKWPVGST